MSFGSLVGNGARIKNGPQPFGVGSDHWKAFARAARIGGWRGRAHGSTVSSSGGSGVGSSGDRGPKTRINASSSMTAD